MRRSARAYLLKYFYSFFGRVTGCVAYRVEGENVRRENEKQKSVTGDDGGRGTFTFHLVHYLIPDIGS